LNKLRAGEFPAADLQPFVPMAKFVDSFLQPFRGSKPTKMASAETEKKKIMVSDMQQKIDKEIRSSEELVRTRMRYTRT
jgi:hypothetical protein